MLKFQLVVFFMLLLPMFSKVHMWYSCCFMVLLSTYFMSFLLPGFSYSMMSSVLALDLMSSSLIILTVWVTAMMILASSKVYYSMSNSKFFIWCVLTLLLILVNCFMSPNMFMFYVWFEASLIPTMIIIMVWGYQPERLQASVYLMIYTVAASLPLLCALFMVFNTSACAMMPVYMSMCIPVGVLNLNVIWLMLLGGFMVKLPLFVVHLWLPKAHVEAPIAGSMILAAVLLKLGGYGILRVLSILGLKMSSISSMIISVSLLGAWVTSMICLRQSDLKSLIAYSSVGHMGLMMAGAMTQYGWGLQGSLAMMLAHGLSSSALFVMANINYEFFHTRSLFMTKGILVIMPILSMWWFLFSASNMAVPPTINLLSEILLLVSVVSFSLWAVTFLVLVSFLTVAYTLYMYVSSNHGKLSGTMNCMLTVKIKDYGLMLMHIIPIILFILKPETITGWNI